MTPATEHDMKTGLGYRVWKVMQVARDEGKTQVLTWRHTSEDKDGFPGEECRIVIEPPRTMRAEAARETMARAWRDEAARE